jgi:hypothetical protein
MDKFAVESIAREKPQQTKFPIFEQCVFEAG